MWNVYFVLKLLLIFHTFLAMQLLYWLSLLNTYMDIQPAPSLPTRVVYIYISLTCTTGHACMVQFSVSLIGFNVVLT